MKKIAALAVFILGVFASNIVMAQQNAPLAPANAPSSFADVVEGLLPAVVNISTTQKIKQKDRGPEFVFPDMPPNSPFREFKDFFEQYRGEDKGGNGAPARKMYSLGSGFVIDPDGYVLTNNHVVADADEVLVKFQDDKQYKAKIVGKDKSTDIALLKIDAGKKLPFLHFGDSDKVRVGDWTIAIGNPFGLGGTVTAGIISARSRDIYSGPFDDFLQTDAAINRGNSGGPMFNVRGEVIGMNTAIFSPTGGNVGIGFAVPSSLVQGVVDQLKKYGKTKRGWLGVKIQTVSPEIADSLGMSEPSGALVAQLTADSPAAKAGVKVGDIITSFDGKPVTEMRKLPRMVAETEIGRKVELKVFRNGESKTLSLSTGELKESVGENSAANDAEEKAAPDIKTKSFMGMSLADITPEIKEEIGLQTEIKGVVVYDVNSNSQALERGIQRYDVISKVNEKEVKSIDEFVSKIAEAKKSGRKNALVRVERQGSTLFVTLPIE